MTDRSAALSALLHRERRRRARDATVADAALDDFYRRFEKEPLVIDKWFALAGDAARRRRSAR